MNREHLLPVIRATFIGAVFLIAPVASATAYRPPGGPHPLYHGGDNQATYPPLSSVGVGDSIPSPIALRFAFLCYPNPSRGGTRFRAMAVAGEEVRVRLFSVTGRLVREWRQSGAGPRWLEWEWDGRDAHGRTALPGLYFYRADSGRERVRGKLVLLGRTF